MIRYTLKCAEGHQFESWFRSADAFETLQASGQVSCPICGSTSVDKAIMAPRVSTSRDRTDEPSQDNTPTQPAAAAMTTPPTPEQIEQAVAKLRAEVEANSDYVGVEFATEARKIHEGEAPARAIYGEAKLDDAKALIEEGVPVLPLPFTPKRKMN
ncbi:DUF1178 family protein [Celeribacter persicus]|uniref:DUF1178 family protein n=1 Tax=Celeribacter persicus TaxID=1651082 RepID=A0A2T5HVV6_9RHOB|nr:DUF1178 family protein [Celeribacter persicus]PTQ75733.1 hypothetical protein C8N42_101274 [Celeribacter persicus]